MLSQCLSLSTCRKFIDLKLDAAAATEHDELLDRQMVLRVLRPEVLNQVGEGPAVELSRTDPTQQATQVFGCCIRNGKTIDIYFLRQI